MSDDIPATWENVSLRALGEWRGGGTPSKAVPAYWDGSIPWVSPKDMKADSIVDAEDHITEDAIEQSATSLVPSRAVLMVTRSGILAHSFPVAVAKTAVALNQDLKALIPHEGINSEFVAWALRRYRQDILAGCSKHGTTVHSVETPRLQQFEIPLAPTNEQERIVEKIEELFSQIEAGEEALERAQKLLERYRQSILNAAVTGELTRDWREQHNGELESGEALLERILQARREAWEQAELAKMHARGKPPKDDRWKQKYKEPEPPDTTDLPDLPQGWVWASVEQVAFVSGGLTKNPRRQQFSLRMPYLRVANVYADELRLDDVYQIGVSESEAEQIALKPGDLLVVEGNGSYDQIGRVAVWDDSIHGCGHQNHLIRVRLLIPDLARWVLWWFLSAPGRRFIEQVASSTSGLYTLSLSKVSALAVPIPSYDEAIRLVSLADEQVSSIGRAGTDVARERQRSKSLRQNVLALAFSGKLMPQDPADEPALILLERITEERAATAQDMGRRRAGRRRQPSGTGESVMVKTRKEIKPTHLRDIVRPSNGGMAAEALWKASELHIDDFYKQLREEVAAGLLREERDGHSSLIVCG